MDLNESERKPEFKGIAGIISGAIKKHPILVLAGLVCMIVLSFWYQATRPETIERERQAKLKQEETERANQAAKAHEDLVRRANAERESRERAILDVPMRDGKYESTRSNDLEELCKDYVFYRKKILQASRDGDENAANKYRASFQQINAYLNKYRQEDIDKMFKKIGE